MKLAIMQPYFFPYLGYFQLLRAVDKFVVYDDVNFIKQGWINRNFILHNCKPLRFTIPLKHASSFSPIYETQIAPISGWKKKFLKIISQAYRKAPFYIEVYSLIETVVEEDCSTIAQLASNSIFSVLEYLEMSLDVEPTSRCYMNEHLKGQERVLDICRIECCKKYYNLSGGMSLYEHQAFKQAGIDLRFVQSRDVSYGQFGCRFVPNLSMIDVLMFNDRKTVITYLDQYEIY